MTDDLDRFQREIIAAHLRDDGDALRANVQSLIVTCRQLRNENTQAWEQAGSDRADLNAALVELDAARMVIEALNALEPINWPPLVDARAAYNAMRKQ